jgi:DNA-binding NarL/FixJ family response regulator
VSDPIALVAEPTPRPADPKPQPAERTPSRERPIRVAVVEDHPLVREGLRLILSGAPDVVVVGEVGDAGDVFEMVAEAAPGIVLLDITLGAADAIPLLRELVGRFPSTRVIVVTMHDDAETVRQAFLAGALGYVVKGAHGEDLLAAIRAVARGEQYVHSAVAGAVVEDSLRWVRHGTRLSPRERDVVRLVSDGLTAKEVGRTLGISAHTVRRHIANVAAKLGVRGRAGIARYAFEHGLLHSPR